MSITSIAQFSTTASSNTDINGVNINTGWPPNNVGNAVRTLMSFIADNNAGTAQWNNVRVQYGTSAVGGGSVGSWNVTSTNSATPSLTFGVYSTAGALVSTPLSLASGGVTVTGGVAASGEVSSALDFLLSTNGTYYYGKDTGGTSRALIGVDGTNYHLQWSAGAGIRWVNAANSVELMKLTNAGALTVNGATTVNSTLNATGNITSGGVLGSTGTLLISGSGQVNGAFQASSITASGTGYTTKAGSTGGTGGNVFNFFWTGSAINVYIDSTFLGTMNLTSDEGVKQGIQDAPGGALDRVMQWRVIEFEYADVGIFKPDGRKRLGFSATQLQGVSPDVVYGSGTLEDPLKLDQTAQIAELTAALQELRREVASLKGAA